MLRKAFRQHTEENRLIRLALVFVLLFAMAHVALHDLDVGGDSHDRHGECQVCRLDHVPAASLSLPSLFTPLQLLTYVVPIADTEYQLTRSFHTQWVRAPPLF